jgi:hypothetical protein
MSKETDVRFSYSSIVSPIRALTWSNSKFIEWANDTGYSSAEFFPYKGTSAEILIRSAEVISSLKEIRSGHVVYNPYATNLSVLVRREDPLRKNVSLGLYNLAFVEQKTSQKVFDKLEEHLSEGFHVVTYPYEISGNKPYGEYKNPVVQTHPAVFNDESTADDLIRLVKEGKYKGVAWDTFHALESTKDGNKPLGNWEESLNKLLEANVVKEVHVQAGRVREKYSPIKDMSWLKGMTGEYPDYNNELGQMCKMVKAHDPTIPFVIEINTEGLAKAGMVDKTTPWFGNLEDVRKIHGQLIDYVKRV